MKIKHTQMRPYPDTLVGPEGYEADLRPYFDNPPSPQSTLEAGLSFDREGANLLYLFRYGDLTIANHDSTGPLSSPEPGQAAIRSALAALGAKGRVDVEIGAIAELQNYSNGLVDAQRYAEAIGAKVFFPQHHGNWNPPASSPAPGFYEPWKRRVDQIRADRCPQLCFVVEATRATAFNLTPSEWAGDATGRLTPSPAPAATRADPRFSATGADNRGPDEPVGDGRDVLDLDVEVGDPPRALLLFDGAASSPGATGWSIVLSPAVRFG